MAKPIALCDLIESMRPSSAIIFCNTKSDTQMVEALLRRRGFDARRINSDLSQSQRDRVMKKIRARDLQFLIATDIAARGIDIEQIDLVVNYSIHEQPEAYVHRTGRTGRAGRHGKAISLVGPRDFGAFHFLKKVLEVNFEKINLPSDDEVAEARLNHLYEVIRQKQIEIKDRDRLVAKHLLSDMGGIGEPAEELEIIVAKLARYAVEHVVQHDAKALDEELDIDHSSQKPPRDRDEKDRGRQKGQSRRSEDEGERSTRNRDKRRSHEGERGNDRGERPSRNERSKRSSQESERFEEAGNDTRAHTNGTVPDIKVYVGQGSADGLTVPALRDLAVEFANLQPQDLKGIELREHYGFISLSETCGRSLIQSLNGIEYNGTTLPVEFAGVISEERERRGGHSGRSRHPRERDRGGRRQSRDQRDRGRDRRRGGRR